DLSCRAEEDAGVVAATRVVARLVERAEEEVDAEAAGESGEARAGPAVERLGAPHLLGMGTEVVGVLGSGDEGGAMTGGALDQRPGALPVGLLVGGGRELDGGGEKHRSFL